ncbi:MAG: YceI family protein [Deltaproteobacteria bacterium]|nr:YceI family protein [Deltaproteobacteria bacterium]
MKKSFVIAFALLASNASFAADKYVVNTTDTTIAWTGSKSLVDSKHVGTIDVKEGYLEFTKGDLTGGQFVVDMTTIKNSDVKDEKYNQKLVGHLKSEDFFHVSDHPTASFIITKVTPVKKQKDTYNVTGTLTIKGTDNEYTIENVKITENKGIVTVTPSITINRKDYGITYNAKSTFEKITDELKDRVIADEFTLDVKLVAAAEKAAKTK